MAGDQVLMWAAIAGVAAVMATYPRAFEVVQWIGAAYLAWLGLKMLLAKPGDAPVLRIEPRHYFRQGAVITLLNPKAIVFYMAFFPLFINPTQHQGMTTYPVSYTHLDVYKRQSACRGGRPARAKRSSTWRMTGVSKARGLRW